MKFMITNLESLESASVAESERERRFRRHQQALQQLVMKRGVEERASLLVGSARLASPAETTVLRPSGGGAEAAEGPLVQAGRVVAGFDLVDLPSHGDALDLVRRCFDHPGHVSEVRPVRELWRTEHGAGKHDGRRFALLLRSDEEAWARFSPAEQERTVQRHVGAGLEYVSQRGLERDEPLAWCGVRLHPSAEATTLRTRPGESAVTDGPFAESREVLGGVIMIDCASREEAQGWAGRIAGGHEVIEIRPVVSQWWILHA